MQARSRLTPTDRFWKYVVTAAGDKCWDWTGYTQPTGEPVLKVRLDKRSRTFMATRLSWELHNGSVPQAMFVKRRPTCTNSVCCKPEHLFLVLKSDAKREVMKVLQVTHPRFSNNRGANHPRSKLTEAQVTELRQSAADGARHRDLAEKYGVSEAVVSRIVNNKAWVTPKQD